MEIPNGTRTEYVGNVIFLHMKEVDHTTPTQSKETETLLPKIQ